MKNLATFFKSLLLSLLLSSLLTVHVSAFDDEPNDECSDSEIITITDGVNIFSPGTMERAGRNNIPPGIDYFQVPIPADGNITIEFIAENSSRGASLLVGRSCNNGDISSETTQTEYITTGSFVVNQGEIIFIKIYNGDGKEYDLKISYDIDVTNVTYEEPAFCYEYNYDQNDLNLSKAIPGYISDTVSLTPDVHVNLYLKLVDNNYTSVKNIVVDIIDINNTQAYYSRESVWLKKPGRFFSEKIADADLNVSNTYIKDIEVGTMIKSDSFAIDYDITPRITNLHFPINARITYDLPVPTVSGAIGTISSSQSIIGDNIPICPAPGTGYAPAYSIFNVEDNYLNNSNPAKYNLLTQTANRVDDLEIVSYEINNPHTKNPVTTFVGVEIIDLNNKSGFPDACSNPYNAISPRVWIPFLNTTAEEDEDSTVTQVNFNRQTLLDAIADGTTADQILNGLESLSTPEEFYSIANENTAFRIVYAAVGDDQELLRIIPTKQGFRLDNFEELVQEYGTCRQQVQNPNPNVSQMTWQVAVACGNDGNDITFRQIATCMECLYGYDTRFLCSRDNFAIRPESFRVRLNDQDQNSPATQSYITTNNTTPVGPYNVAAGYQYALEINATNHQNDNATPGYNTSFPLDGSDGNRTFRLKQTFTVDLTKCNDIEDHNKTLTFINGAKDLNISSRQVGEYDLTITDKLWTRVDWDDAFMEHHTGDHFTTGDDCDLTTSYVPNVTNTSALNGCVITSYNHINNDTSAAYYDIPLRVHPYKFDLNSSILGNPVTPMVGPNLTRDQTFVYIDTPPTMDANDTNMSYNMNGTFVAAGYDGNVTSNFVTGCYADNVNMTLDFIYNYGDIPTITPYLSYSLKDYNTTGSVRPGLSSGYDLDVGIHDSTTTPFIIDQNATYFSKDMNGAIKMNLGYNFERTYNQVLNPRYIQFNDFNITYVTNPSDIHADLTNNHQIYGDIIVDQNVSFFYGRAKPSKFFYEDITSASVNTPISIVIYCGDDMSFTDCSNRGVQTGFAQTNEVNWWLSLDHNTNEDDGDVVLVEGAVTQGGSGDWSVTPNVDIVANAINTNILVDRGTNPTLPLTVEIDLDTNTVPPLLTNRWLIYNEYYNSIPSPFYKVRFIGISGWAGHGDTGHVVDSNTSVKKHRRLGW